MKCGNIGERKYFHWYHNQNNIKGRIICFNEKNAIKFGKNYEE